jgi:hypothetical protein
MLFWMIFGLVNDTPIVAQLFYSLVGIAVATGVVRGPAAHADSH